MYCRNCNVHYPEDAVFCNLCGSALEAPIAEAHAVPEAPIYDEQLGCEVATKKPKKKGLGILLAALASVGLVAGLLYYLLVFSHPANQIQRAWENTVDQLLTNTPMLANMIENIADIKDDEAYTMKIEYSVSSDNEYIERYNSAQIRLDYDNSSEQMSLQFDVSSNSIDKEEGYDFSEDVNLQIYADSDAIYAQTNLLKGDVYTVPLADFGEEYEDSELSELIGSREVDDILETLQIDLFADIGFDTFCSETDEGEEFLDSLEFEKSDEKIPHTKNLTVYRMEIEADEASDAAIAYVVFAVERLFGEDLADELDLGSGSSSRETLVICFGVNDDNCLTAIYAYAEDNEDEYTVISWEGKDNIWDKVVIYNGYTRYNYSTERYVSGEEKITLRFEQERDGFEVYMENSDGKKERILQCDDSEGEISIYADDIPVVLKYSDEDDGLTITYSTEESDDYGYIDYYYEATEVEFSFMPLDDVERIDGDDAISIFDLSRREWEKLIEELDEAF